MEDLRAVCVFCGSSTPPDSKYSEAARAVARHLVAAGLTIVYGGGQVGLMGELADAALAAGGRVIGIMPVGLFSREVGHTGLTELHEVDSMHERKQMMYDRSDGFIALPGGLGTLEELAEVATWSQLGIHRKPLVLLDVDGFWQPLTIQLDRMVAVGLLKPASRALIQQAGSAEEAVAALAAAVGGEAEKWISEAER